MKKSYRKQLTDDEVKNYLRAKWHNHWWGLMDCDRCPLRTKMYPCNSCGRWKDLVADFRAGNLTKMVKL